MNPFIETMNQWGGRFASFAWPMFWQSVLLMAVVLGLEFILRRRVRASVRYALWLVVLVKLCLPPTLALPTSPAWWVHQTPPPAVKPPAWHYSVTYGDEPMATSLQEPVATMPGPALNGAAWLLMVSLTASLILLTWLLVRWWQIGRQVRWAETSSLLTGLCLEAQQSLGMRTSVRVKIAPNTMSPAVCGLFQPTILIPRALTEHFSDDQLRAVLLHELIHVRRKDVWVNFLQSLLQIFYWWHPLLWVANACIRRVREEAVDDGVMLALRDGAEAYAPTLLEVAKLALNRPLASLGLVGILESRQALRQRIERLVEFRAPRRAGLTIVSVLGILAFTAVAVPMGQGPVKVAEADNPAISAATLETSPTPTEQSVLVTAEIYEFMPGELSKTSWESLRMDYNTANDSMVGTIAGGQMDTFRAKVKSLGVAPISRPRIQTNSGKPAIFYMGNGTKRLEFECLPSVKAEGVDLAYDAKVMRAGVDDESITNEISGHTLVEDQGGIFVCANNPDPATKDKLVAVISVQLITNGSPQKLGLRLQSVIRLAADSGTNQAEGLATRTYKVDVKSFVFALQTMPVPGKSSDAPLTNSEAISIAVRNFLTSLGVSLESPAGKAVFFNDRTGILLVRATKTDLDTVEKAIETLNGIEPQIHIKARFYEVSPEISSHLRQLPKLTNGAIVLPIEDSQKLIQKIHADRGTLILSEPEVETTSGRQTQMRTTDIISVITNVVFAESNHQNSVTFNTSKVEFGPIFDTTANVQADGYTIDLRAKASDPEFWGYARVPKNIAPTMATNSAGEKIPLPMIWPAAQVKLATARVNLYDGQMLALSLNQTEDFSFYPPDKEHDEVVAKQIRDGQVKNGEKEIVALVTVTIVDEYGNRVHSDDELPFAKDAIPPQTLWDPRGWQDRWDPRGWQNSLPSSP